MKIAYFWTWDFSRNILEQILKYSEIEVCLCFSQPDRPVWRKKILEETQVKKLSIEKSIKIFQPEKLRNNLEIVDELKKLDLDFIVVVAYGQIIPKSILEIPKYGCINIHGSILPKYRWASPIQECLKNWDKKTWLTIMYMNEKMDEWDLLKIQEIEIDKVDKTQDIFSKFEEIWPKLLVDTLKEIVLWNIKSIRQDDLQATYCTKIEKNDWKIDFWLNTVSQIYNKYRAYHEWPWIYTYYNWKKLDILDMDYEEVELEMDEDFHLWDVIEYENHWKNSIWIICLDWILILNKIKLEWKKEMDIFSFINWNKDFLEYNFL
jgi:methionyl-tRNA formyltransferase